MPIKKYYATSDTTITNAFKEDLQTRATGSNMGLSDSLEAFTIYNQVNYLVTGSSVVTGSQYESARILIKFNASDVKDDYDASTTPSASNYYLRLHNAKHPLTLPKDYTLELYDLTKTFTEGHGLDMETYKDEADSNWMNASSSDAWTASGAMSDVGTRLGTASFADGDEDLLIDITSHVRGWRDDASSHKGFIITFPTSSLSNVRSYYTKKFFARGTEYFFNQPSIEARWDDSVSDDRGKVYKISNRLSNSDNTNNLYLYNWYNGTLQNIDGTPHMRIRLYSDSSRTVELSGSTYTGSSGLGQVTTSSAGIFTVPVRIDTDATTIYTKWYSGATTYHEDSLAVKTRTFPNDYNEPEYIISMPNLKAGYSRDEDTRLRLYTRLKDWSPTIYTVASKDIENQIVTKAYYRVVRLVDDLEVISYGTGSLKYTKLSYDVSGSYFDLDMSLFESGYSYGVKYVFDINGKYREQPETFKFRVD
tara:strand:+ start:41 stop:1474 length:1434 start_codon:yes stop_codon:yes gene_type:complete